MTTRKRARTPAPWRLERERWQDVGIHEVQSVTGELIPTHVCRGDLHAADIIEGRYPLDKALADERARVEMMRAIRLYRFREDSDEPATTLELFLARMRR